MKVFLDTGALLWLLEGNETRAESVRKQLSFWLDRGFEFGTSTQTLAELLVHPKAHDDTTSQYRYRVLLGEMISGPFLSMDDQAAELSAEFVAKHGMDMPTASQLAVAVVCGFDVFYTTQDIPPGVSYCQVQQCFGGDVDIRPQSRPKRRKLLQ